MKLQNNKKSEAVGNVIILMTVVFTKKKNTSMGITICEKMQLRLNSFGI